MSEEAEDLMSMAHQLQDKMVMYRHHLHTVPELDLSLPKTTAYVKEALESMGLKPTRRGIWANSYHWRTA